MEREKERLELTNCENYDGMQKSRDISSDGSTSRQDVERNSRMFGESFEVYEEDDSSESENERNENFERSPFVSYSSPSQTENGRC